MTYATVVPILIVIIVPSWLASDVTAAIVAAPSLRAFSLGVRGCVAPDELSAGLAIQWASNSPPTVQKRKVLDYLQVVVQNVDMVVPDVDRVFMMRWRHSEQD